jgi:hypothetical protein
LLAMNPLKFGLGTPLLAITLFRFCHITHWTFVSSNYISHITIVMTCNKKNHTHGKRMSSNPQHALHDQTWAKQFGGCPRLNPFN